MEGNAECMLVLIGATPEGKKELVGFQTGVRESAQSWRKLLIDIKQRGLEIAPDLAVGDGVLGFWKAIEEVFPSTRRQRCWVHKTANVLNKVALSVQVNMKADLREIYGAPTRAAAEAAIDLSADKYRGKYDKAVAFALGPDMVPTQSLSAPSLSSYILVLQGARHRALTLQPIFAPLESGAVGRRR
jgi:putative transposase